MAENTLREASNVVHIEGLLLEVRHNEWKSGEGLGIELDIETGEGEVHTVTGMSRYTKKDGTENGIAKGFKTIVDDYKSVASVGREEADKIRINQGSIGVNEYYGQDGQLRSFPQLSSNFFNRLNASDEYEPKAEFKNVEMVVKAVKEETNREGEETGRTVLEGLIPLFGGKIIPFTFVVDTDGAEYVMDNYEKGQTVSVDGDIVNKREVIKIEKERAFGKPKSDTRTSTVREYLITSGSEPYEEDDANAYDMEVVKKALTEREIYLEEMKKKQEERKNGNGGSTGGAKKGFDTKSKKDEKPKIDDSDLPF